MIRAVFNNKVLTIFYQTLQIRFFRFQWRFNILSWSFSLFWPLWAIILICLIVIAPRINALSNSNFEKLVIKKSNNENRVWIMKKMRLNSYSTNLFRFHKWFFFCWIVKCDCSPSFPKHLTKLEIETTGQ